MAAALSVPARPAGRTLACMAAGWEDPPPAGRVRDRQSPRRGTAGRRALGGRKKCEGPVGRSFAAAALRDETPPGTTAAWRAGRVGWWRLLFGRAHQRGAASAGVPRRRRPPATWTSSAVARMRRGTPPRPPRAHRRGRGGRRRDGRASASTGRLPLPRRAAVAAAAATDAPWAGRRAAPAGKGRANGAPTEGRSSRERLRLPKSPSLTCPRPRSTSVPASRRPLQPVDVWEVPST